MHMISMAKTTSLQSHELLYFLSEEFSLKIFAILAYSQNTIICHWKILHKKAIGLYLPKAIYSYTIT